MKAVLCPVEVMCRDLSWRIACACGSPDPEIEYWIGQSLLINDYAAHSSNCVYLGKNVVNTTLPLAESRKLLEVIDRNGSIVLFLDEEGGIYRVPPPVYEEMLLKRHPLDLFTQRDAFLLWGTNQKSILDRVFPQTAPRSAVTGHPRFDLPRPKYHPLLPANPRAEALKPFILFNTSFSFTNNLRDLDDILRLEAIQYENFDEMQSFLVEHWTWENANQGLFVRVVNELARRQPRMNLVVRPHPVEAEARYHSLLGSLPNVHIIKDNSQTALEWIVHARAVVHAGCTTGLESALADRPVIALDTHDGRNKNRAAMAFEKLGNSCHDNASDAVDALVDLKDENFTGSLEDIVPELFNASGGESFAPIDALVKRAAAALPGESVLRQFPTRDNSNPIAWVRSTQRERRKRRRWERFSTFKFTPWDEDWISERIETVAGIMGTKVDYHVESSLLVRIRGC
jgi:surface carbohydrate biosynthesis protein